MPFIIKTKPKQYTVEYEGARFLFNAPTDQQSIMMLEVIQGKASYSTIEGLIKTLLVEVFDVVDQDGNALTAKQLKGAASLGGALCVILASKLSMLSLNEKEAEEKNA